MGRTKKVRGGRGPPTNAATGPSGLAQSGPYDLPTTTGGGLSGNREPTLVQPAYLSQQYLAATMAHQPWHGTYVFPGMSKPTKATLAPPPGLDATPFPQSPGNGPPLPTGLTYRSQGPYPAELTPKMVDLAQLNCRERNLATLAQWTPSGDELPMEFGASEAELNLLTNLVHNLQHALLMTSPTMGENFCNDLSCNPPGLTLPA